MANRLDVVIFGATGFTGQFTVEEVVRLSDEKPVSWGVAGRNKSKLDALLKRIGAKFGKCLCHRVNSFLLIITNNFRKMFSYASVL